MKRALILLLLITISFAGCKDEPTTSEEKPEGLQEDIPWPSLADSPWPMNRANPQCTGRSRYPGPLSGILEWKFGNVYLETSLAVGPDSVLYLNSQAGLYAVNPDGTKKWFYEYRTYSNVAVPIISAMNVIYTVSWGGDVFALDTDGSLKWKCELNQFAECEGINIGKDGTIYILGAKGPTASLSAVSTSGELLWQVEVASVNALDDSNISFSPDGNTIYLTGHKMSVIAFDINLKSIKWTFGNSTCYEPVAVDCKGNLYLHSVSESHNSGKPAFYSLKPDGTVRWSYVHNNRDMIGPWADPAIDIYGNTYFAEDTLYSLDYNGTLRWKKAIGNTIVPIVTDNLGNIFIVNITGTGYHPTALNNSGEIIWEGEPVDPGESPIIGYSSFVIPSHRSKYIYSFE